MVRSARTRGIEAHVCAAEDFAQEGTFDLAVSNAVFHWILAPRPALSAVYRALRPGGRFVGELGGEGNVASLIRILTPLPAAPGIVFTKHDPKRFPDPDSSTTALKATGFRVSSVERFERPTPLPTSLGDWIDTFGNGLLAGLNASARSDIKTAAEAAAAPIQGTRDGTWVLKCVSGSPRPSRRCCLGEDLEVVYKLSLNV